MRALYYTTLAEDQEYSSIRPLVDWLDQKCRPGTRVSELSSRCDVHMAEEEGPGGWHDRNLLTGREAGTNVPDSQGRQVNARRPSMPSAMIDALRGYNRYFTGSLKLSRAVTDWI